MWCIWKERNSRCFEDIERSMPNLKLLFLRTLFDWFSVWRNQPFSILDLLDFCNFRSWFVHPCILPVYLGVSLFWYQWILITYKKKTKIMIKKKKKTKFLRNICIWKRREMIRLVPCLWPAPFLMVWHWVHLVLKIISSTFGIARWCLLKWSHFIVLELVIEDDIIYN